jgi:hypothetical protein
MIKPLLTLILFLLAFGVYSQNFEWVRTFGGNQLDVVNAMTVDDSGNVVTTGYYYGISDFDPSTGISSDTSNGNADLFVQKMDASGNFKWAVSLGSNINDQSLAIETTPQGDIYITGSFSDTVDFDPGPFVRNLISINGSDAFVVHLAPDGTYRFAKAIRSVGVNGPEEGRGIAASIYRNKIYTVGRFNSTADFDPGPGVRYLFSLGGSYDVYLTSWTPAGVFHSARSFGGTQDDVPNSIFAKDDNIYICGYFSGTVNFDPNGGLAFLTSASGSRDGFIMKFERGGVVLNWARKIGGNLNDDCFAVSVDDSKNVYTTGEFKGTVDFDPGPGIDNRTAVGGSDIFIHKMDSMGNYLWVRTFGDTATDRGKEITIDQYGSIYTTGVFSGTVDFDPDSSVFNLTSVGKEDIFVHKMDASGKLEWAHAFGSSFSDSAMSITVDRNGNIYTAGVFQDTVDFDTGTGVSQRSSNGSFDVFVHKMSQPLATTNHQFFSHSNLDSDLRVYPNPTSSSLFIDLNPNLGPSEIIVHDLHGRIIYQTSFSQSDLKMIEFNYPVGIYFLSVLTPNSKSTIKVVKE